MASDCTVLYFPNFYLVLGPKDARSSCRLAVIGASIHIIYTESANTS